MPCGFEIFIPFDEENFSSQFSNFDGKVLILCCHRLQKSVGSLIQIVRIEKTEKKWKLLFGLFWMKFGDDRHEFSEAARIGCIMHFGYFKGVFVQWQKTQPVVGETESEREKK